MPQPDNDQIVSPAKKQDHSIEKRSSVVEETQRVNQDIYLREQSFETSQALKDDRSQDKRKRMDISL